MVSKKLNMRLKWKGKGLNEKAIDINTGKVIVDLDEEYLRPSEVEFLRGDFSKAKKKLKWIPNISTQELIDEMIKFEMKKK